MAKAEKVKELRERTGAGLYDCKRAFDITDGDIDEAEYFLRTGKNPIYYEIDEYLVVAGNDCLSRFIVERKDIALDYCKKNRNARCYKHSLLKDDIQEIEVE